MTDFVKSVEIIYLAKSKGINLFVDKGRLAIKKEESTALPPDLMKLIQAHKIELIDFLEQELQSPQQAGYQEIPNVAASESYPISNAQYRIWLVSQTEEGSVAYHVPNTIVVNNALNEAAFRSAVDAVIERHEILRTVFKIGDAGEVRQYVLPSLELGFSIDFKDFRAEKDAHAACKLYIPSDVNKPFDLSRGPLLRAALLRMADEQYVFYYNMHHIISDAWSREVLSRDVMTYYKAYMMGVRPELAPMRIQYKDYAAWQLDQLSGPAFQDHKDYWLSRFRDEVALIDLPTSKRRPKRKTYHGQEIGLQIGPDAVAPLRNLAVERGGSLFMGLVSIWKVLLHRYTGETDITIGNPVSGRNHPDLEDQIGFYINILPLRTRIDPDQPFTALFDQIKEETLGAYKHQAYPFGKLLEDLNLSRDISRSPLFDLDMDYRTVAGRSEQASEAQGVQDRGMSMAKYDIEFDPIESADGVYLLMRFNLDVYEYPMMERLIGHYKNLLQEVALHPEKRIRDLNYLSVFEQQQLLYQFNDAVSYPPDQTVVDLFLTQVQKTPDAKAVVFSGKSLTYAELNGRSNRLAHYLISANGMVEGDFVGIHLDIGVDYIVAILGILKAGGAYVPIDTEYPSDRKKFLAENAAVKAIVTDTNYMFGIDFYEGSVLAIDVELDAVGEGDPINLARPEALAYVLHTSGSTGVPKGVMVEHRNLMDYSAGLVNALGLNQAYSYGLMSTPSADLGNTVILGSLVTGGVLHMFSRAMVMDVFALNAYFQANPIDIIKIVPSHWLSLSSGDIWLLPRKTIVFGGEKLVAEVINKVSKQDAAVTIFNHYGPTETTIGKLMHQVDPEKPYTSIPLGKPFSNTSVYILDKNLHLVSVGVTGELYIAGAGLARGYLNSPEMTAARFIDHPFAVGQKVYKTGDLARWTPDGEVEFIGRADDQVKIRGHRVEVKEIEWVLNKVEGITQSVVVAKADSYGTAHLVAYFQSGKEALDKVAIQEVLREKLPEYMIPRVYVQVEEIPLTSNGKIDYKVLAARADAESDEDAYVAPDTPEEEALAAAWQSVLKRDQISILDNFYHLGGDSLKAIQLFILLKKKGYDLPITSIIENPTLKDMATGMQRRPDDPSHALEPEPTQPTQHACTEASENQRYFIKRPWAMVPSRTITLSNFSETTFREKLVAFLSCYPSLLTVFERDEKEGIIRQCLVPYSDVKLDIELIRECNANDYTQTARLEEMAGAFLAAPFAYFTHSPLIRFFLVVDPGDTSRAFLRFSMAHALIDIDTCRHITENLERHWEAPEGEENAGSNYSFAQWQKHFLGSAEGALQRKWWLSYLKPLQPDNHPEPYNGHSVEYLTQRLEITGEQFKSIQETVKTLNVPIAALFLAAHQCLLSELGEDQYLQKIAVNGREQNYEEGEVMRVLGLTTNFLPVRILPARSLSFLAYVRDVYVNYMQVRLHQNIPYEVIRKDLLGETGRDIDKAIKGYFNFRVKEKMSLQGNASPDATISVTEHQQNNMYGVGLICDLFENGIAIRLKCPKEVFTQHPDQIRVQSFIHGKLLDPIASGSYF